MRRLHAATPVALALLTAAVLVDGAPAQPFRKLDGHFPGEVGWLGPTGDVDGDGDVDAVAVDGRVLLNDGTGRFGFHPTASVFPVGSWFERERTHLVDLDLDGDLDLFSGRFPIAVWLNDGGGVFSPSPLALPPSAVGLRGSVFDDLDGDGDVDAFVIQSTNVCSPSQGAPCPAPAELWLNDGVGNLTSAPGLLPPGMVTACRHPVALDLDADGVLEIFLAQAAAGMVGPVLAPPVPRLLLVRPSLGSPYAAVAASGSSAIPDVVLSGDFDGDGLEDVFVTSGPYLDPMEEEVFLNRGDGTLAPATVLQRANRWAELACLDLDGDGSDELVRIDGNGADVFGLAAAGTFTNLVTSNPGMRSLMPRRGVDLDGDADEDLVTQGYGGFIRVAINDGAGSLAAEPVGVPAFPLFRVPGDLDGDGDLDFLMSLATGPLTVGPTIADNDGRGGFTTSLVPAGVPLLGTGVFLDADNDGDLDRLTNGWTNDDYVRNDGPAGFVVAGSNPATLWVVAHRTADVNGDGLLDVVMGRAWPQPPANIDNMIALNTGAGFAPAVSYDPLLTATSDIDTADLDGDGDVDIVEANAGGVRWLANDGTGAFTPAPAPIFPFSADYVVAGDLDGDGDQDLVFEQFVRFNQGGGVFNAGPPLPINNTRAIALVDTDLDGDLDIFANDGVWNIVHLTNDGTGTFINKTVLDSFWGTSIFRRYPVGDVDGDGDPDLLVGNGRWITNTLRQVHAVGIPRPGIPLPVQVHAASGTPYELWAAPALAGPTVFPQGTLWLDPLAAVRVATATIGPTGIDEYRFNVPNLPGIVGASLHWQSFITGQGALTSAETTTW